MIISHKNHYIFIHCRKTAGSSISLMLSETLGPWDVQLSAVSETLQAGGTIPVRMWAEAIGRSGSSLLFHLMRGKGKKKATDALAAGVKRAYQQRLGRKPQHADAEKIKLAFPREWDSYSKFCVVRNPFSLAVSDYIWRTRNLSMRPSFPEYIKALAAGDDLGGVVPVGFYNNWRQYTIDNRIVVDHVIKFENLSHDLGKVLSTLGVPFSGQLPRVKDVKSKNRENPPLTSYRDYYTREAVEIVSNLYRYEIDAFGYTFA